MKRYIAMASVILALVLMFAGCTSQNKTTSNSTSTIMPSKQASSSSSALAAIETVIESIYTQNNPSVVNIQVDVPPSILNLGGGALGSGFVWDNTGNIVTNNHVIDGATDITVTFYEGTMVPASLVGTDPDSDLAVIKVNVPSSQLQPVILADSTSVKVGQLAVAIGNPFGLQSTLTLGFISALGRILPANENAIGPTYSIPDIIKTDAAINPGNSGGVLLDDNGMVIGVTAAIASQSGTSSGVGFVIPSAIVQQVVPSLISTGHYVHPYLGVTVVSLNPDIATAMNLDSNQRGAMVVGTVAGGPSNKAGLRSGQKQATIKGQSFTVGGDIIVAINNNVVKSSDDLISNLARYGAVGQTATLTILRDGKQNQVQVTVGARPSSPP